MLKLRALVFLAVVLPLCDAAHASTITVGAGDVPGLITALNDPNADTINLTSSTYSVTAADNYFYGPNAFPVIHRSIVINGNGALIARSGKTVFRFFYVSGGFDGSGAAGSLTLNTLELQNGLALGGNGGAGNEGGGGGAGLGGAIFNQGTLTLNGVTLDGNQAIGGTGGAGTGFFQGEGGGGGLAGAGGDGGSGGGGGGGGGMQFAGGFGMEGVGGNGGGFITALQGGVGAVSTTNGLGGTAALGPIGGSGANGAALGCGPGGASGGGGGFLSNQSAVGSLGAGFGQTGGHQAAGNPNGDGGDGSQRFNSSGYGGGGAFGGGGGGASTSGASGGGGGIGGGGGGSGSNSNITVVSGAGGFGGGGGGGSSGGFGAGGGGNGGSAGFGGGFGGSGGSGNSGGGGGGAGLGGAIFNHLGTLTVKNSTCTLNSATGGGGGSGRGFASGGSGGSGYGGGIFNLNGSVTLLNCTLSNNTNTAGITGLAGGGTITVRPVVATTNIGGGALYTLAYGNNFGSATAVSSTAQISNSILARSTGGTDLVADDINGSATNTSSVDIATGNLVMTQRLAGTATITGTPVSTADPVLSSLFNNGGMVKTMLPSYTSPAINAGNNVAAASLATDQRGQPRISGSTVDIGAVETEYALVANAGDGQFAVVNNAYFTNLQIKATEIGSGFVYTGITVSFSLPGSGASGTFASTASGSTDKFGLYTAPVLTANTIAGPFQATCSATHFADAIFNLTNLAGAATTLTKVDGDNQFALVSTAVPVAPKVQVTDSFGNGVPFLQVTFAVASGGGSVSGAIQTTDNSGFASVGSWTLGAMRGANTLTATADSVGRTRATLGPVTFTATAFKPVTFMLVKIAGDNQTASFGTTLPIAPKVQFTDSDGNPLSATQINFTVKSGGGSITGAVQTTDDNGFATVGSWTLGPAAGTNTLQADVTGFGSDGPPVAPAIFTATAVNLPPVIDSAAYTPAPSLVNTPTTFTVTAHDPEKQPVTISFDYGDGSSGSSITHTYLNAGTYTVTISASDGVNITTATLQVIVNGLPVTCAKSDLNHDGIITPIDTDSDCDGYADYIEALANTNMLDVKSTLNNGKVAPPTVLFGMTLDITLVTTTTGHDKFTANGYIPVSVLPNPIKGSSIIFDISGFAQKFTLNAHGYSGSIANQHFALLVKPKAPNSLMHFIAACKLGRVAPFLRDNSNLDANGNPDHAVVQIVYQGIIYRSIVPLHFVKVKDNGLRALTTTTVSTTTR